MSEEKVFFPESLMASWLGASFLLMTASLLFYHMTRIKSLEMDPRIAGIFAVSLILIALMLTVATLFPYYERIGTAIEQKELKYPSREQRYRNLYLSIGIILAIIEFSISIAIIRGSFFPTKTLKARTPF
jgi:hypothetical protein